MRVKEKRFYPDAIQHIYQRAVDRGVIFYHVEDRLVLLTTAAVNKRKYGIIIPAFAVMFTHIHQSAISRSRLLLSKYLQDTNSMVSRAYNAEYSRIGQLFERPPGISQKKSWKDKKSNIIYVYNNHVEKKLCARAIDERWSLLAYAFSDHPFSEPITRPSKALVMAMKLVDRRVAKGLPLKYKDLHRVFSRVSHKEAEQYIDYVISRYALVDYDAAAKYFEDISSMVTAIDSTTGGEFNIKEDFYNAPDAPFIELGEWFRKHSNAKSPYELTESEKLDMAARAKRETTAWDTHLRRFFHIK